MDVSDRRLHVQLTQEAKIASDFSLIMAIFAFAGFISALGGGRICVRRFLRAGRVFPANSAMGISPALPIQMPRPSSRKMSVPRPVAPLSPWRARSINRWHSPPPLSRHNPKNRAATRASGLAAQHSVGKNPLARGIPSPGNFAGFQPFKANRQGRWLSTRKSLTFYMASPPLRVSPPPQAIPRRSSPPPGR